MPLNSTTCANLLVSDVPISFWGGIDPQNGDVIDEHHPLHGKNIVDRIVAIPGSRGSCSGSGVLLEVIMTGFAPAALVFCEQEEILVLGALVAQIMFDRSLPVLLIDAKDFAQLSSDSHATIHGNTISVLTQDGDQVFTGTRLDTRNTDTDTDTTEALERSDVRPPFRKDAHTTWQSRTRS